MTYKINIKGIVQGVGFRPFIYRLAKRSRLKGEVYNTTDGVEVFINTSNRNIVNEFIDKIKKERPSPSLIEEISFKRIKSVKRYDDFNITPSMKKGGGFQLVSPDIATCDKCLEDIMNQDDKRRYSYAFTNCTNCGPRFTIIKSLPYDRPNTTMSVFDQCDDCLREYENIDDRRFHAQPNACRICGPTLMLIDKNGKPIEEKDPISVCADLIKGGYIVGVKGLGGFQIACDALDDNTVKKLRERKNRPFKPFAVMFSDLLMADPYVKIDSREKKELTSSQAPIVLLEKKNTNSLSRYVSFSNKREGVFLPYTPIHHMLLQKSGRPLVMTSGNISEEPIAGKNSEALKRLSGICDYYLTHDREIFSKYDDSVVKVFKGRRMILRRARGFAPYPIKLSEKSPAIILATGAQEKNTFCIVKDKYAIVSQHIGELDDLDSYEFYKNTLDKYISLFNIDNIDVIAYDMHPGYISTQFATGFKRADKKIPIQHHEAHLASVLAENSIEGEAIGFLWDGTGYGHDGTIWGSEVFVIDSRSDIKRMAFLEEIELPGAEATIKRPYRMAITYLFSIYNGSRQDFKKTLYKTFPHYDGLIDPRELDLLLSQLSTGYNSVNTTSMGRLFDAVSSALGITHISTYEGQAAIDLEMTADLDIKDSYDYELRDISEGKGILSIGSKDLYGKIVNDIKAGKDKKTIASKFHNTIVDIAADIAVRLRSITGYTKIALSGGVFQNHLLLSKLYDRLQGDGFKVYINEKVPINDGGISLGQAYIAMDRIKKGES